MEGATVSTDAERVWESASAALQSQVTDTVWGSTFQEVRASALDDDVLTLEVPSQLLRQRVEQRYLGLIEAVLDDIGHNDLRVVLEVHVSPSPHAGAIVPGEEIDDEGTIDLTGDTGDDSDRSQAASQTLPSAGGARRYSFDTFVIGSSNRFAHAAALSVAETPARSYNPLFVYGGAGLGKTHLLQAIASYVRENYPAFRIRYMSTETMLNEFVDAIRGNTQPEFKQRYREIDVLLVDDIQFMEGKEQLQEEFFHTFNTLHDAQRQIVLSSDRPPDAIADSRGSAAQPVQDGPDHRHPAAGLRDSSCDPAQEGRAGRGHGYPQTYSSSSPLNITYNIRELEGALIRVNAYAALNDTDLTVPLTQEILGDVLNASKPRQITPAVILDATADQFGLEVAQLQGKSRTRDLVHARQVGMYVCRELTDLSYPQIGKAFGGRDHTTVIYAYEKVSKLMKERRKTYEDVTSLVQHLLAGS